MTKVIISRRERKKADIRTRLISTAIDLFSRNGIDNVTVERIAEAADIGKGTIYNYFQTKEDIIVAFMADFESEVQAKLNSSLIFTKEPVDVILTKFIQLQFQMKEKHHAFVRVFLAQMFLHTAEFHSYMVEMQKAIDPPLETLFNTLQQRERIRTDIPLPDLIMTFKTMQLGLTSLWAIEGPPFRGTKHVLRQEIKLFCEGLMKK